MALAAGAATVYILILNVFPKIGHNSVEIYSEINRGLSDSKGVSFIFKTKIKGEKRVIAAVNVTDISVMEQIIDKLSPVAAVEANDPVIPYDEYGLALGLNRTLAKQRRLDRDNIFYVQTFLEHYGNSTEEFLAVVKVSVEQYIEPELVASLYRQSYKHLGERRLTSMTNIQDLVDFERRLPEGNINKAFGSNVHLKIKGAQLLDDYIAGINKTAGYY